MRYPPFSKPLVSLLSDGFLPKEKIVFIYMGEGGWEKAYYESIANPFSTLLLPLHHLPNEYIWPVFNCYVFIIRVYEKNQSLSQDELNHRITCKISKQFIPYENVVKTLIDEFALILFKCGAQYVGYSDIKKNHFFHYNRT